MQSREEPLLAVGLWLKAAREQRNESLDSVAGITRIGKTYLEAIETGAVAKLPSQAYTRGFVRLYASHLDLSPEEALRMLQGHPADAPLQGQHDPHHAAQQTGARALTGPKARRFLLLLVSLMAVATATVLFFGNRPAKTAAPTVAAAPTTAPPPAPAFGSVPAPPADKPTEAVPPAAERVDEAAGEGLVLRLKAVENGKMHITIDGSLSQEYDLVSGDLVEWKAEKTFLLDLENAASVEAALNGKPLQPFGDAGKAAHLIISRNGIQRD